MQLKIKLDKDDVINANEYILEKLKKSHYSISNLSKDTRLSRTTLYKIIPKKADNKEPYSFISAAALYIVLHAIGGDLQEYMELLIPSPEFENNNPVVKPLDDDTKFTSDKSIDDDEDEDFFKNTWQNE